MQDNDILKSADAEFLDQSWEKMHLLLDEHMPHAMPPKPSRPKYELLLLLGLFAWTVYLYWPAKPQAAPEFIDLTADQDLAVNSPTISIEKNQEEVLSSEAPSANQNTSLVTASTAAAPRIASPNLLKQPLTAANDVPALASNTTSSSPLQSLSQASTPILAKPLTSDSKLMAVSSIPSKGPQTLNELRSFAKPTIVPQVKQRKLTMGIHAGEIIDRNRYSGFTVGVFAEISLNNRFSLFSALELNSVKKVNPIENSFNAAEDFFALHPNSSMDQQALGAGMSILYGTDVSNADFKVLGVDEMNYVNVPIELVFKVNPAMRVNAGLSFSYLLNTRMQNADRPGGWTSNELVDGNPLEGMYGQELLGVAINRFDLAPSIGFSFKPVRKLTLDLKFRNGIIDISKDKFFGARESHTNRYLHLGVGWDLYEN